MVRVSKVGLVIEQILQEQLPRKFWLQPIVPLNALHEKDPSSGHIERGLDARVRR